MKTAKKVLSVLMAVALILGSVAIAASAWSLPETEDKYCEWSLKAEVMDCLGATELKNLNAEAAKPATLTKTQQAKDVTAYKNLDEHEYFDDSSVIYVQPGQIVWITTHVKTYGEFYPAAFTNHWYYTNGLFLSSVNTNGYVEFKEDDNILAKEDYFWPKATFTTYAAVNDTTRKSSSHIGKASDAGRVNTDLYHWVVYNCEADVTSDPIFDVADIDEDYIAIPLYVDPDASLGDEGIVYLGSNYNNCNQLFGYTDGDWYNDPYSTQYTWDNYDHATLHFIVGTKPAGVDYTALNEAIAAFEGKTEADYTPESWADADAAYNDALDAKDSKDQKVVDDAATALNNAIAALEEAVTLDYEALDAQIAAAQEEGLTDGKTTSSVTALEEALEHAIDVRTNSTDQMEIWEEADTLEAAILALEDLADPTALIDALDAAADADTENWDEASKKALEDAVAEGQGIMANIDDLPSYQQSVVKNAAKAINDALANYKLKGADYKAVDDALANVPANLDNYTPASVAALNNAINAVVRDYTIDKQADVNKMAADIEDAIANLKELADTTALEAAIAAANAAADDDYAADVWTQIQDKVAEGNTYVGAGLAKDDAQDDIDTLATEITTLLAQKLGDANYDALNAAIADAEKVEKNLYTDETVAAFEAALADAQAVPGDLKADSQKVIDDAADALVAAQAALEEKDADYTYVEKYQAQAADVNRALYTEESLAALDAALAAVQPGKKISEQDVVTGWANDLYVALEGLTKLGADYDALDEAIASAEAVEKDLYTEESVAAFEEALAAANAVARDLTIEDQKTVDDAAKALTDAQAALKLKPVAANYEALDAAIADAEKVDTDKYTDESVAAFEEALAAAKAVDRDLTEDDQATIDNAAKALTDAQAALEEKPILPPVEPSESTVTEVVNTTNSANAANTYDFTVEGRKWKIQTVDADGNTVTVSRTNLPEGATITSYDADGNEVSDLDPAVAYEVWEVPMTLKEGDYTVISRDTDTGWEAVEDGKAFTVEFARDNAELISIEAPASAVAYTPFDLVVTTGKDVTKIRVDENGSEYKTFSSTYSVVDGDTRVFTVPVKVYTPGTDSVITVAVKTADGWQAVDTSISATVAATK